MHSLSYQEKSLYGSLIAELAVYLPYFFLHGHNSVDKVAVMILAIVVLQIILQALIAAFTRNRTTDERDKAIQLRGYRAGYFTLATVMVLGLTMLWFHANYLRFPMNSSWLGLHLLSVFFGMLVIADVVKTLTQILAYRRVI